MGRNLTTEKDRWSTARWAFIGLFAAVNTVVGASQPGQTVAIIAPFASILLLFIFTLMHGARAYGGRVMLAFLSVTCVISWGFETISILTGFPFGHYHYSDLMGPKIWLVPAAIMPSYFAGCYLSWRVAGVLVGEAFGGVQRNILLAPVVASFVAVGWDLCMDPIRSTYGGLWVWERGGAYFGVPVSNFFGWALCVFTILLIFAFILRAFGAPHPRPTTAFLAQPIVLFAALASEFIVAAPFAVEQTVTAADGTRWSNVDLYRTAALASFFTIIFAAVLALFRLSERGRDDLS